MRRIAFYLIGVLSGWVIQAQDTVVTQNLKHMWVSIDSSGELSPYVEDGDAELIFFELTESNQHGKLQINSDRPIDIWLNNKLIYFQFSTSVVLDLDSIRQNSGIDHKLKFKIFARGGVEESLTTQIIQIGDFLASDLVKVSQRKGASSEDLYILIITIILFLAGVFRRFFPITFKQSIQNPLSLRVRSMSAERTYDSFGSLDNMYSVFFLGAISSLFLTYLGYELVFLSARGLIGGLLNWLVASLVIALGITVKYWWTKIVSFLYQFREIPNIQAQDFIRFFTLVFLVGVALTLLDFSLFNTSSVWFTNLTLYLVLFALIFFQVWFFRKFDKFYSHKKLMIISYLCTTEFLPGFLAIYWLVKM